MRTLFTLEMGGVLKKYAKVFKLDHYNKKRKQYMAELLSSHELLELEMIAFAKNIHFAFPWSLQFAAKRDALALGVKNKLFSLKKKTCL